MTPLEQLTAWRGRHKIVPVPDSHKTFGPILRCETDGIRVHWILKGYRHDTDEIAALLANEYGGLWSNPKMRAIERIVSDSFTDLIVHCHDNHAEGCSCRWSGVVTLPEIVIESNEGYVVVAEVAPDA